MKRETAASLGVVSITDLALQTPRLTLGSDLEFLSRPEWGALKQAYGLAFRAERSFNPTFMYRAVESGQADVISAFSSDGRMAALDLVALTDPQQAIPSYDAVVLLAPARAADPMLHRALARLLGAIPVETMREANLMVDRDQNKASPAQAARLLAEVARLAPP
jgi:osmoprotectant transport system permease protein